MVLTGIVAVCTSAISAWVTYFFTRKRYLAEVDQLKTDNDRSVLDYYQDHAEFVEAENKRLREENQKYMSENFASKEEITELKIIVQKLTDEIRALSEKVCVDHDCRRRKTTKRDS